MTKAFCPGHLTCFFHPVRSYDPLSAGSRGVGIKLSRGSSVTVEERSDQRIEITMDGLPSEADITRLVLRMLAPELGFDVTVDNELPVSQGFGMSAAGAIAAALCVCQITGKKRPEAFRAAHLAEIEGGGGLGDVSALMCECHTPVRMIAGLPPLGKVAEHGEKMPLSLAVMGPSLNTGDILGDKDAMERISAAGAAATDRFISSPTVKNMFRLARRFSKAAGLETREISDALDSMRRENAAMCMLGNSIFSTAPSDVLKEHLGPDVPVIACASTGEGAKVTHKA